MDQLKAQLLKLRSSFCVSGTSPPAKPTFGISSIRRTFSRLWTIPRENANLRTAVTVALICASVISIPLADIYTGPDFSFQLTYLMPIFLSAWFTNRNINIATVLACVLLWTLADAVTGRSSPSSLIWVLNLSRRLLLLVVVALLLAKLRRTLGNERESARTDPLTSVLNLRAFYEVVGQEIYRAARYRHPVTVAYIDIDDFKTVNDRHGHQAGDKLLCTVSAGIQKCLRKTDIVARLGGDEFAILLPETGQDAARVSLSRIQKILKDDVRRRQWPVTFSIGVLTCTEELPTVEELIRSADLLMYSVKKSGKDSVRYAGKAGLATVSSYVAEREMAEEPNLEM